MIPSPPVPQVAELDPEAELSATVGAFLLHERFLDAKQHSAGRDHSPDRWESRFVGCRQEIIASDPRALHTPLRAEHDPGTACESVIVGQVCDQGVRRGARRRAGNQVCAAPTVSAMTAPRRPSGFSGPAVESRAV